MDIAVIGCGIAGLVTSYHLLNNRATSSITIFEQRTSIPRKHCTGIISLETLTRLPLASKFVKNVYKSIVFFIHGIDIGIKISSSRYFACRIDRIAHEVALTQLLHDLGVEIYLGSKVINISVPKSDSKYSLIFKKNGESSSSKHFDKIIIAEGYPPKLSRKCGLIAKYKALKSLQGELLTESPLNESHMETLYVFISSKFFGKGFAWLVPIDKYRVIIGCSSEYMSSVEGLSIAKSIFGSVLGLSYKSIEEVYGGYILQGYPINTFVNGIMGIGDSVAMTKSISGGGLYAISLGSKLYSEIIGYSKSKVHGDLRKLFNELKTQYIIKDIVWRLLEVIKFGANSMGKVGRFVDLDVPYLDYDRHELLVYSFLTKFFKLKGIKLSIYDVIK